MSDVPARMERWATERPLWFGLFTATLMALASSLFLPAAYAAVLGVLWFLLHGVAKEAGRRALSKRVS